MTDLGDEPCLNCSHDLDEHAWYDPPLTCWVDGCECVGYTQEDETARRIDLWSGQEVRLLRYDDAGWRTVDMNTGAQTITQVRQHKTDRGVFVYAALLAAIVLFLAFTAGYWYRSTTRPMPCTETQVYVWADYPDDARCVSNIDHAAHSGGTHR